MSFIKVGFCVAYDWHLLKYAIPAIYQHSDVIYISIDRLHKTWAGEEYAFDQKAFDGLINSIDVNNKVKFYHDDFYVSTLTTAQNEVRQRQMLAEAMGQGGWHIQLDCDEYFLKFGEFVRYLKSLPNSAKPFNVCCPLVTVFKEVEGGYLCVQPRHVRDCEYIQIASTTPQYLYGRRNGLFNIYTNFLILHQSWARSEKDVEQKISNWGHNKDFNPIAFISFWRNLNAQNFTEARDFHPLKLKLWSSLIYYSASSMEEFIQRFPYERFPKLTMIQIKLKNSRLLAKVKVALRKTGFIK